MARKAIPLILLAVASTWTACSSDKEKAAPRASVASVSESDEISYGRGFSDLERSASGNWRWMSGDGVVTLRNHRKDMTLHVTATVPDELQGAKPPTFKVLFAGKQIDQFTGTRYIDKEYTISAAQQADDPTHELEIISDKVFSPKDHDPTSTDGRKLGLLLNRLSWEAK